MRASRAMASVSGSMLTGAAAYPPSRDAHAPNAWLVAGEAMKAQDQVTRVASAVRETHHAHADSTLRSLPSTTSVWPGSSRSSTTHLDGYARLAADLETPIQIGENFYGPLPRTARPIDCLRRRRLARRNGRNITIVNGWR